MVAHGLPEATLRESLNKCVGKWVVGNDGGECLVALAAVSFSPSAFSPGERAEEIATKCANRFSGFEFRSPPPFVAKKLFSARKSSPSTQR